MAGLSIIDTTEKSSFGDEITTPPTRKMTFHARRKKKRRVYNRVYYTRVFVCLLLRVIGSVKFGLSPLISNEHPVIVHHRLALVSLVTR